MPAADMFQAGCVDGPDDIADAMAEPGFVQDPYPLYARMRRDHPVYRSRHGIWYVTRHADVQAALRDPHFSMDQDRLIRTFEEGEEGTRSLGTLARRFPHMLTNTDPPDHTRLRRLVGSCFTAGHVQGLRGRVQAVVDELLEAAVSAGNTMDLVEALASPLPAFVIFDLFGISREEGRRVRPWFGGLVNPPDGVEGLVRTLDQFEYFLSQLIGRRRGEPGDDMVSALVLAQVNAGQVTDAELLYTCFVLLTAAVMTTTNLVGSGTLALLEHPNQLRRLQQDPTMIGSAVDELMRYDTPTQRVIRIVAGGAEIGSQTLEDGELVHFVLGAANRDPERFDDPDQIDIGRRDNRHLTFGGGPHFCLGAHLARLEAEVAIGTLVRSLPALRLDTDCIEWQQSLILRGPTSLPVSW